MSEDLWGPIDIRELPRIPFLSGRLASVDDVKAGRAVFYLENTAEIGAKPGRQPLPCCAILREEGSGSEIPVVVIQIEEAEGKCYIGYRPLSGGNGIATPGEFEFLPGPDKRFGHPSA